MGSSVLLPSVFLVAGVAIVLAAVLAFIDLNRNIALASIINACIPQEFLGDYSP